MNKATGWNRVVLIACAAVALPGLAPAEPGTVEQEWDFPTSANPAAPDSGGGTALVQPGALSLGWNASLDGLEGAEGMWDLGRNGVIRILPHALAGEAGLRVTVAVREWQDGWIYSEPALVTVPCGVLMGEAAVKETAGDMGGWIRRETTWIVPADEAFDEVLITGSAGGSVIEGVEISVAGVTAVPYVMQIERVPGRAAVLVSWSVAAGPARVQTADALAEGDGWKLLTGTPGIAGDRYVVEIPAGADMEVFRLTP